MTDVPTTSNIIGLPAAVTGTPAWPTADVERLRYNERLGGDHLVRALAAFRDFQDAFAGSAPPTAVLDEIAAQLSTLTATLSGHQVPETGRWDGRRNDLPARGFPVVPPWILEDLRDDRLNGRVVLGRFYLGGNTAAHGGTIPLLFDDVLGRLANHAFNTRSRTARLVVNFRRITQIGAALRVAASIDAVDGRKRWLSGRLIGPDGVLVADAEGLFLELKPGQP